MAGGERNGSGPIAGINVTPLVDVVLVLLVIFIVTAKIVVTPALPIDLPQASNTAGVQVVLSIIVPARGPVLLDGQPADDEDAFREAIERALAEHPELRAVLHAEGSASHAKVMAVLDRLRSAGVERVAFAAAPLAEGG